MALGELYHPKGLALETARAVLEVDNPMAVNVAIKCLNECNYCYGPLAFKQKDWGNVRQPKVPVLELVKRQLDKGLKPEGVFTNPVAESPHL